MHVSNLRQLGALAAASGGIGLTLASLPLQDDAGPAKALGAAGFGAGFAATGGAAFVALNSTKFALGTAEATRAAVTGPMTARGTALGAAALLGAVGLGYAAQLDRA